MASSSSSWLQDHFQRPASEDSAAASAGSGFSEEAIAELQKKQHRQGLLRVAAPGNSYDVQARLRLGIGHDIPEPAGHAAPKTKVKGSVAAVDQARLDAEHQRRLALVEEYGPDFARRRLQAERAADERDAAFPYLEQEGEKTELSVLIWNAGKLCRTGQKPASNLRGSTYIANFLVRDHSHIKLIQEASGLDNIAQDQCYIFSKAMGCAIMAHGNGYSIRQLKEDCINPFGAKLETLYWVAGEVSHSEQRAGKAVWRVGSFHMNNEKAKQRDCATAALETMFSECFALQLDFVGGDANSAGLEVCQDDFLQAALDSALSKLEEDARPSICRFCAPGDCIHFIAFRWSRASNWRTVRQIGCQVETYELQLRPNDKDCHYPLKIGFSTGKPQRSAASKVFRASKRKRKRQASGQRCPGKGVWVDLFLGGSRYRVAKCHAVRSRSSASAPQKTPITVYSISEFWGRR